MNDINKFKEIENKILESLSIDKDKFKKTVETHGEVILRAKQKKIKIVNVESFYK